MPAGIAPLTDAGRRFVELAEKHAAEFAAVADQHDRAGTFPMEHIEALKASGAIAGLVPEELGGVGVDCVHDMAVALSRFGRGDGAISIGLCMHYLMSWTMARRWRAGRAQGRDPDGSLLRAIVEGQAVMGVLNAESGSDNRHPFAEATPVEGGYRVRGKKSFGTMSPAATLFTVRVRIPAGDGEYLTANALIPADAPGLENLENWDALGMRASASHDIRLNDVFVTESAMTPPVPWGTLGHPGMTGGVAAALCLAAPFLGIAEAAHENAVELVKQRGKQPGPTPLREWGPVQGAVAENEVDLASMRGAFHRALELVDEGFARHFPGDPPLEELHETMRESQAAKLIMNETAVKVVDRCLAISGGSGYTAKSPLSRYYRDVRAGAFMSPFGALEAREFIARVALDLPPEG